MEIVMKRTGKEKSARRPEKSPAPTSGADSYHRIALVAYLKAEARGFSPGRELDDWLEAEKEITGSVGPQVAH
jgi:DUF2934 family protein